MKIIMPKAGMAMEEGTIIKWFKKEGDMVEKGEPLLEIETDKTSMEVESTDSGILLKILNVDGDVVPVTQTIGYLGDSNENIEDVENLLLEEKEENNKEETVSKTEICSNKVLKQINNRVAATPRARALAVEKGINLIDILGSGSCGEIKAIDVENAKNISATPLAKRVAADKNVDLSTIKGSGFRGKIRKEDVIYDKDVVSEEISEVLSTQLTRKPLKGMRKVIGDKMLQSHLQIPPVTLNSKADVTELSLVRNSLNKVVDTKISFNDFIIKAVTIALAETPGINTSIENNEIVYKDSINIGMAVAVKDGLIVPVIRNADTLSLKNISKKCKVLVKKAIDGKLMPDEYSGGTFTVSNLGMYGIVSFTPIINLPESAILGVCSIENELKMIEGKIESRDIMGLSLTFDHRIIDGAQAALFLKRIKLLLENPLEIMA